MSIALETPLILTALLALGAFLLALLFQVRLEPRHYVYATIFVIALGGYGVAIVLIHSFDPKAWPAPFATLLASLLVATGWVITNEVSIRNSRKQHTINLITQYFTSAQRIADKKQINECLPYPQNIGADEFDFEDSQSPFLAAVDRELNYFEFLAAGIYRRDIDEGLLRDCMQDILCGYYRQMEAYIRHWRRKNAHTRERFADLHHTWSAADANAGGIDTPEPHA